MRQHPWLWFAAGLVVVLAGASWYIGLVNRTHPAIWPMAGGDAAHSNMARVPFPKEPKLLWTFPLESDFAAAPVVGQDGTVYVATGQKLLALGPDGKRRWSWDSRTPIFALALGRQGDVYTLDRENVTALHPDGTLQWVLPADVGDPLGLKVGQGGVVYAVGQQYIYAIGSTGQLNWRFKGDNITAGISENERGHLFVTVGTELYALNHQGDTVWHQPVPVPNRERVIGVGAGGNLYVKSGALVVMDGQGKKLREESAQDPQGWNLAVGRQYLQDGLTRYSTDGKQRLWSVPGPGGNVVYHVLGNEDGTVLITFFRNAQRGRPAGFMTLYSSNGQELWTFNAAIPQLPPAVAGEGRVCFVGGLPNQSGFHLVCMGDK